MISSPFFDRADAKFNTQPGPDGADGAAAAMEMRPYAAVQRPIASTGLAPEHLSSFPIAVELVGASRSSWRGQKTFPPPHL